MKKEIYRRGIPGKKYGIWHTQKREWVFDICEDTPMLANARLYQILGDLAKNPRYEPRILPDKKSGTELVKNLRKYAERYRTGETLGREIIGTEGLMYQAADVIEELERAVKNEQG